MALSVAASFFAPNAFAEANYVYHERTGANPGCGAVAYVPVLNPTSAQAYDLRFKVEYQFFTDALRVYYTTDGSTPAGAFGTPSGTTAVVNGSYLCTFGSPLVDVCGATIPAQPAGTVVKYIVSASHSGGGAEIFANGPGAPCSCGTSTSSSGLATVFQYTVGSTTDLYWDINGATAGAGGASPSGTWNTGTPWSTVFDGTAATVAWTSGRNAVLSAGTDGTGTFAVNLSSGQTAGGVTVEEGTVSFTGSALTVGTGTVTVNSGATMSIPSTVNLVASAGANLNLEGGTFRSTVNGAGSTFVSANFTINVGAAGGTVETANTGANSSIFGGTIKGPGYTLTKTGSGEFRYQGTGLPNTTFSKLVVNQGLYRLGFNASISDERGFGAVPGTFTADAIILSSGASIGTSFTAANSVLHANRGITLGAGGGGINGNMTIPGAITGSGSLSKTTTGTLILSGNSDYTGITFVDFGILQPASANALGSSAGDTRVPAGAEVRFDGSGVNFTISEPFQIASGGAGGGGAITVQNNANVTISGPVTLTEDAVVTVSGTGTVVYDNPAAFTSNANQSLRIAGGAGAGGGGTISGVINLGTGGLTKTNGGRWTLSGANIYSGPTVILAGTLRVANTTGSATGSGDVTVASGATLSGSGTIAGSVSVTGTISAGTSPGTINTGNETWNGNGTYLWEINDVDAGQGTDPGWDLINITGDLKINANVANKFTIRITSLTLANAAGVVHDFDSSADYTWTIVKTTGGITGFDPAVINLDSASFSNALGSGLFIVETANGGNDVVLRFVRRPSIAAQPVGGSAECTSNFTFAVTAAGTAPLNYQWKHAGTNLAGATSPMLTVAATAGAAGNYVLEVSNAYGVTNSDPATLTVVDTTPPAITCGQNQSVGCGAPWDFTAPTVSDACDGTNVILTIDSSTTNAACGNTFAATRIWRVMDQSGNGTTCTQVVTIVDQTAPTITCASSNTAACGAALNFTEPTASDGCNGTNVTITVVSTLTNQLACGYTVTRTWQATDPCTNSAQCSQTITVMDTLPPTITCPSNVVVSVPPNQTNAMVTYPPPQATDLCSSVTTECAPPSGSTFAAGTTTVTCTATDGCSNVATCTFTVTISTGPVAGNDILGAVANHSASVSAAKLLANDAGGNPISISAVSPTSTNGGSVTLSAGVVTYTPVASFVGTDVFTYTLQDNQGGTATGTVTVLVRSANAPSANHISTTPTLNGVLIRFAGIPGRTYGIERSVDQMTWISLGSVMAQANGLIEFEDTSPPQGASYRTVVP